MSLKQVSFHYVHMHNLRQDKHAGFLTEQGEDGWSEKNLFAIKENLFNYNCS